MPRNPHPSRRAANPHPADPHTPDPRADARRQAEEQAARELAIKKAFAELCIVPEQVTDLAVLCGIKAKEITAQYTQAKLRHEIDPNLAEQQITALALMLYEKIYRIIKIKSATLASGDRQRLEQIEQIVAKYLVLKGKNIDALKLAVAEALINEGARPAPEPNPSPAAPEGNESPEQKLAKLKSGAIFTFTEHCPRELLRILDIRDVSGSFLVVARDDAAARIKVKDLLRSHSPRPGDGPNSMFITLDLSIFRNAEYYNVNDTRDLIQNYTYEPEPNTTIKVEINDGVGSHEEEIATISPGRNGTMIVTIGNLKRWCTSAVEINQLLCKIIEEKDVAAKQARELAERQAAAEAARNRGRA